MQNNTAPYCILRTASLRIRSWAIMGPYGSMTLVSGHGLSMGPYGSMTRDYLWVEMAPNGPIWVHSGHIMGHGQGHPWTHMGPYGAIIAYYQSH